MAWRVRKASLIAADVLALVALTAVLHETSLSLSPFLGGVADEEGFVHTLLGGVDVFLVLSGALIAMCLVKGMYSRRRTVWHEFASLARMCAALGALHLIVLLSQLRDLDIAGVVVLWAVVPIIVLMGRAIAKRGLDAFGFWRIPARILGTGENARVACRFLREDTTFGYSIDAFIEPGQSSEAATLEGMPVLPLSADEVLEQKFLDGTSELSGYHIVIALDGAMNDRVSPVIDLLTQNGHQVDIIPPLKGLPQAGMQVSHVFGRETVVMHARAPLSRPLMRWVKRLFDIVVSSLLLVFLAPLLAYVAWRVKREDGGPAFFQQSRKAYDGRRFNMWKFRTMRLDAEQMMQRAREENSALWQAYVEGGFKLQNDPRITEIGGFLRSSSLDELPQLLNVLRGDMSLVGPRPLLLLEAELLEREHLHHRDVRPGITGVWQVSGRSDNTFEERLAYDDWYSRNWSIWADLMILIKTAGILVSRKGAY